MEPDLPATPICVCFQPVADIFLPLPRGWKGEGKRWISALACILLHLEIMWRKTFSKRWRKYLWHQQLNTSAFFFFISLPGMSECKAWLEKAIISCEAVTVLYAMSQRWLNIFCLTAVRACSCGTFCNKNWELLLNLYGIFFFCLKHGNMPLVLLWRLCYNIASDKNTLQHMPTLMSNQFLLVFHESAAEFFEACKKCNSAAEWLLRLELLLSLKNSHLTIRTRLGGWASVYII